MYDFNQYSGPTGKFFCKLMFKSFYLKSSNFLRGSLPLGVVNFPVLKT